MAHTDQTNSELVELTATAETNVSIEATEITALDDIQVPSFSLEIETIGVLNYPLVQAKLPVVDRLLLNNDGSQLVELENVQVQFISQFEYIKIEPLQNISLVIETEKLTAISLKVSVDAKALFTVNEPIDDTVTAIMTDAAGRELARTEVTVEVLPMNYWFTRVLPQAIAAFVQPNAPKIIELQRRAAQLLKNTTGESSFSAYQSDDKTSVRKQMAAIYGAIYEQNIIYATAPPSFTLAQRIRTVNEVLSTKIGNCIEMSILFCSVAEACGLNPFIVLVPGHAYAGVWLADELFSESFVQDFSELDKRLAPGIHDVEVVECTCMNEGMHKSFEQAVSIARERTDKETVDGVIDVRYTHYTSIRPMPMLSSEQGKLRVLDYGLADDAEDLGQATKTVEEYVLDLSAVATVDKKTIWMRNLLDISKRNSLISFRPTPKTIQLFGRNLGALEDALADGKSLDIKDVVSEWRGSTNSATVINVDTESEFVERISEADYKAGQVHTFLEASVLQKRIKEIYRDAKKNLEESGANSLYLALGLLRWIDTKGTRDADGNLPVRRAPLVLVPIELVRGSRDQYSMRVREDEPQFNITLIEMLRTQFNLQLHGLNPLPQDESGVDLKLVFSTVRRAVMSMPLWDVEEVAFIANFSFSSFVMWNDLRSRFDKLTENKVVRALVDGRYTDYCVDDVQPSELDCAYKVSDIAIPSSIDSSQLAAVIEASEGVSFVLHGPPGTGKSQTITNMIANSLYQGKTVLFVAEKMAALNVVAERLAKIGLGNFCGEIHSNKIQKRVVLDKIQSVLELKNQSQQDEYIRKTNRIQTIKDELNRQLLAIHTTREQGFSLYDMIELCQQYPKDYRSISFDKQWLASLNRTSWDTCLHLLSQTRDVLLHLGTSIVNHPLHAFTSDSYSLSNKEQVMELCGRALSQIDTLRSAVEQWTVSRNNQSIVRRAQTPTVFSTAQPKVELSTVQLAELAVDTLTTDALDIALAFGEVIGRESVKTVIDAVLWERLYDADVLARLAELVDKRDELRSQENQVFADYVESAASVDLMSMATAVTEARNGVFAFITKSRNVAKVLAPLNALRKGGVPIDNDTWDAELVRLQSLQEAKNRVDTEVQALLSALGGTVNVGFDAVDALLDLYAVAQMIQGIEGYTRDELFRVYDYAQQQSWTDVSTTTVDGEVQWTGSNLLVSIQQSVEVLQHTLEAIQRLTGADVRISVLDDTSLTTLMNTLVQWQNHIDDWKDWALLQHTWQSLDNAGLSVIVKALQSSSIAVEALVDVCKASMAYGLIKLFTNASPELAHFNRIVVEGKISEYNDLVKDLELLSQEQVKTKLLSAVPDLRTCSDVEAKQLAQINRVIQSKGRGVSIRDLFNDNAQVMRTLLPCMLMSPLSVAQYIDLDFPKFDLVIFDEASQIRTGTAIGAMSRANDVIIVGDPKQMPPTNFFNGTKLDEENLNLEDLESLLEDCLAVNMPQRYLACHYRSQSESLIAFSNEQYYDGKMMTFPAPTDLVSKVTFTKLDGIYDRGVTRTNPTEAEAIVKAIETRLRSGDIKTSIGVITFNMTQANLIEDKLQALLDGNVALREAANAMSEPIFVKNLENVQGDERDCIYFSITYGPNEEGKVYQNYGPLGQNGGWRRLNVAVSRARKEMHIMSTMNPSDIVVTNKTAEGVRGLRDFMQFASTGIMPRSGRGLMDTDDFLTQYIADYIRGLGYDVHTDVGTSQFKIPLAVVVPGSDNTFGCAILIDNESYAKLPTMRDRNALVPSVLSRMGWSMYRIWTLDWFEQTEMEQQRLKDYLMEQLGTPVAKIEMNSIACDYSVVVDDTLIVDSATSDMPTDTNIVEVDISKAVVAGVLATDIVTDKDTLRSIAELELYDAVVPKVEIYNEVSCNVSVNEVVQPIIEAHQIVIIDYKSYEVTEQKTTTDMCESRYAIIDLAQAIVDIEAPIHEEYLMKRISEVYSGARLTANSREFIKSCLKRITSNKQTQARELYYWGTLDFQDYYTIRIPTEQVRRDMNYINNGEIGNAVLYILQQRGDLEEDTLCREVAKLFGFARMTDNIKSQCKAGVSWCVRKKLVERAGKIVRVVK